MPEARFTPLYTVVVQASVQKGCSHVTRELPVSGIRRKLTAAATTPAARDLLKALAD